MIATGILILFLAYVYDALFDLDSVPYAWRPAVGLTVLGSLTLLVIGAAIFAWEYLP